MSNTRTVFPQVGMNVLMCATCAKLNEKEKRNALKRGKTPPKVERHFGTLFVPIGLWIKAAIESGRPHTVNVRCHSEHHTNVVTFQGR